MEALLSQMPSVDNWRSNDDEPIAAGAITDGPIPKVYGFWRPKLSVNCHSRSVSNLRCNCDSCLAWLRTSPHASNRLKVKGASLASPLEIAFAVAEVSMAVGGVAVAVNRVLVAVKTWVDVLAAGVDLDQRRQALEENRTLATQRRREAELSNALREQQLRRATAEGDLVERARDEILGLRRLPDDETSVSRGRRVRRTAGSLTSVEFAELLDEPMQRLLGYAGGELEVAGDEPESS